MLNYKFRLYPTKDQEQRLVDTLEINRIVYNYFVEHNFKNRNDMNYALTELKEKWPVLRNHHSKMLQMVATKVAAAWEGLKMLKQNGYNAGDKLHFLQHDECNSFTYNQSGFKLEQCFDGKPLLRLAKIGHVEIRIHRKLPIHLKQVTILRQAGKWFAVITCAILKRVHCALKYEKPVGIDVGIKNYVYDSDGNHVDNPLFLKKDVGKVRRSNKRLSRRVYDSNNYQKALRWHQRLHQRIANKRKDFLHNLSTSYARKYDLVIVEKLNLLGMNKNRCLARHIMDSGLGMFKQFLTYKANRVLEISRFNTSVECSRCGNKVPKSLAVRIHECDRCGTILDRDHNAALNILQKGLKLLNLPMQHGEVKPVETLIRVAEAGKSPRSLDVGS